MSCDYKSDFSDLKPPTRNALGALGMAAALMAQTDSMVLYGTPRPPPAAAKLRAPSFNDLAAITRAEWKRQRKRAKRRGHQ